MKKSQITIKYNGITRSIMFYLKKTYETDITPNNKIITNTTTAQVGYILACSILALKRLSKLSNHIFMNCHLLLMFFNNGFVF